MKALRILVSAAALTALVGCQNYTTAPVCSDANAAVPAGITGVYTVSTQKDDFSVDTQTLKIGVDQKGVFSKKGPSLKDGGEESRLCEINGQFIQEGFNAEVQGYEQSRVYITGMGITVTPLFYDKAALDAVGIPNATFQVPHAAAQVLGPKASALMSHALAHLAATAAAILDGEAPTTGLMVQNELVKAEAVMARSYAAPVGLTYLRK